MDIHFPYKYSLQSRQKSVRHLRPTVRSSLKQSSVFCFQSSGKSVQLAITFENFREWWLVEGTFSKSDSLRLYDRFLITSRVENMNQPILLSPPPPTVRGQRKAFSIVCVCVFCVFFWGGGQFLSNRVVWHNRDVGHKWSEKSGGAQGRTRVWDDFELSWYFCDCLMSNLVCYFNAIGSIHFEIMLLAGFHHNSPISSLEDF